jgi:hypothetical protein
MLGAVPEKDETRSASRYETFIVTFIPIAFGKSNPLWAKLNAARGHVTVEICYCSTLLSRVDSRSAIGRGVSSSHS